MIDWTWRSKSFLPGLNCAIEETTLCHVKWSLLFHFKSMLVLAVYKSFLIFYNSSNLQCALLYEAHITCVAYNIHVSLNYIFFCCRETFIVECTCSSTIACDAKHSSLWGSCIFEIFHFCCQMHFISMASYINAPIYKEVLQIEISSIMNRTRRGFWNSSAYWNPFFGVQPLPRSHFMDIKSRKKLTSIENELSSIWNDIGFWQYFVQSLWPMSLELKCRKSARSLSERLKTKWIDNV